MAALLRSLSPADRERWGDLTYPSLAHAVIADVVVGRFSSAVRYAPLLMDDPAAGRRLGQEKHAAQHSRRAVEVLQRHGLTSPLALVPHSEIADLLLGHGLAIPSHLHQPLTTVDRGWLTRREALVLTHLQSSSTMPEIAKKLHVSQNTVKTQIRGIYRKLWVSDRAAAVARGLELGIISRKS